MTFSEALNKLKEGHHVKRSGWNGKDQYLVLGDLAWAKDIQGYIYQSDKAIIFVGSRGIQIGWLASQADMLTDDWEVI